MSMNSEAAGVHEKEFKLALPQPLGGLLSLALLILISEVVWYGLFSPAGPVSLYTPNVGLSLVITILMVIHWGTDVFDFWPFSRSFISETNPLAKGFILLLVYVGVAAVMMFGIY